MKYASPKKKVYKKKEKHGCFNIQAHTKLLKYQSQPNKRQAEQNQLLASTSNSSPRRLENCSTDLQCPTPKAGLSKSTHTFLLLRHQYSVRAAATTRLAERSTRRYTLSNDVCSGPLFEVRSASTLPLSSWKLTIHFIPERKRTPKLSSSMS